MQSEKKYVKINLCSKIHRKTQRYKVTNYWSDQLKNGSDEPVNLRTNESVNEVFFSCLFGAIFLILTLWMFHFRARRVRALVGSLWHVVVTWKSTTAINDQLNVPLNSSLVGRKVRSPVAATDFEKSITVDWGLFFVPVVYWSEEDPETCLNLSFSKIILCPIRPRRFFRRPLSGFLTSEVNI